MIHLPRQSQFELFPSAGAGSSKAHSSRRLLPRRLNFTMENLVILGVFVMISMVISFSFGVEKGKRTVIRQIIKKHGVARKMEDIPQPTVAQTAESAPLPEQAPLIAMAPGAGEAGRTALPAAAEESGAQSGAEKKEVDKKYTVQVASFKQKTAAKKAATLLEEKGFEALVLSKGKWSVVCVGWFAEKQEATSFSKQLKKEYKDNLVRSL